MKGITNKKVEPVDVTKTGEQTWKELQEANNAPMKTMTWEEANAFFNDGKTSSAGSMLEAVKKYNTQLEGYDEQSPILRESLRRNGKVDYFGNSFFDPETVSDSQWYRWNTGSPNELRAENQPWYSKLTNGIAKGGVLAATTALETIGIFYGIGQGIYNALTNKNGETLGWAEEFLEGLWNNPITQALQKINELSEEYLPNYYTRDEQENPWSHAFNANFIGDKLIKNFGFMVGAYYGMGVPLAGLAGKIGINSVKTARSALQAEMAGAARRVAHLTEQAGKNAKKLEELLKVNKLTKADRALMYRKGLENILDKVGTTKFTAQALGSFGSAVNEGAVEAINNSKDWADNATMQENDTYQKNLRDIELKYGGTDEEDEKKIKERERHELKLEEIQKRRALVGNADLLMNIPLLTFTNAFELGKLYTRGFSTSRRMMGSWLTDNKIPGILAKGKSTLKSGKTKWGGVATSLLKTNAEGFEEFAQRAASDSAGNTVEKSIDGDIDRYLRYGKSIESENAAFDYVANFAKALAENTGNPEAWEEYFIGAFSAAIGMPVYGSQIKNAYAKLGNVGLAGGLVGNYKDYMKQREDENLAADYLNKRINDPNSKFWALWKYIRESDDIDALLTDALRNGDKKIYKDLEFDSLFKDINLAASTGHLEEFKELVGFNKDYSDEELIDIMKGTQRLITADQQKQADNNKLDNLEERINNIEKIPNKKRSKADNNTLKNLKKQRDALKYKIKNSEYKDAYEGPFNSTKTGEMVINDENKKKMREILDRNREHISQTIDNYIAIRNSIDIETDGNLKDDDIELLTMMKARILDYDYRSFEMLDDILTYLPTLDELYNKGLDQAKKEFDSTRKTLEEARKTADEVKNDSKSTSVEKANAEEAVQRAAEAHLKSQIAFASFTRAKSLIGALLKRQKMTRAERKAFDKGYGKDENGKTYSEIYTGEEVGTRSITAEEAQNLLSYKNNAETLANIIRLSGADAALKEKLIQEVRDLEMIGQQKREYNEKVRKILGDTSLLHEIIKNNEDRLSKEQKQEIVDKLAQRISEAKSFKEIYDITKEAGVDSATLQEAFEQAKRIASDDVKNLLKEYEEGADFMMNLRAIARQHYDDFELGVLDNVMYALEAAWEGAISPDIVSSEDNLKNSIRTILDRSVKDIADEGQISTSKGLKYVLEEYDKAAHNTNTNSSVKESPSNNASNSTSNSSSSSGVPSSFAKAAQNDEEGNGTNTNQGGAGTNTNNSNTSTSNESNNGNEENLDVLRAKIERQIEEEITEALRNSKGATLLDSVGKLSEELKKKINEYNARVAEDVKITDAKVRYHLQYVFDIYEGDINDIVEGFNEDPENSNGETRSAEMIEYLKGVFKSDYLTEFLVSDDFDHYISFTRDYENKRTPRENAIWKILKERLAFQFVSKNYLGYIYRGLGQIPPIHLLRSTDSTVTSDPSKPITFLAIEIDDNIKKAINFYGFNNKNNNLDGELNPVTIPSKDGTAKQYQIIGVLSFNGGEHGVRDEVRTAFSTLQQALDNELNGTVKEEQAKDNPQPFVISDKYTVEADRIFTGRLEKYNMPVEGKQDDGEKVSLYTFMTSPQGKEGRRTSTEYANEGEFHFGVIVNQSMSTAADSSVSAHMVGLSDDYMKDNNGAILLYVPKPDGELYPVRCTRRTVGEWWKSSDIDGEHTGESLLKAILDPDSPVRNEYLENIVGHLRILLDENSSFADKIKAKSALAKYFLFGKSNPIHISEDVGSVTLVFDKDVTALNREELKDNAILFFEKLAEKGIKFSLPAPTQTAINGRDVISSGILEIGLRGFYNFNANFGIKPVGVNPDTGEMYSVEIESSSSESSGELKVNPVVERGERNYDFGDGRGEVKFIMEKTDGEIKITYADGGTPTTDELNIVAAILSIDKDTPSCVDTFLDMMGYDSEEHKWLAPELEKIYGKIYLIDSSEGRWVYDSEERSGKKLYKLDSDQGRKLFSNTGNLGGSFRDKAVELALKIRDEKLNAENNNKIDSSENNASNQSTNNASKNTGNNRNTNKNSTSSSGTSTVSSTSSSTSSNILEGVTIDNIREHAKRDPFISYLVNTMDKIRNSQKGRNLISQILDNSDKLYGDNKIEELKRRMDQLMASSKSEFSKKYKDLMHWIQCG